MTIEWLVRCENPTNRHSVWVTRCKGLDSNILSSIGHNPSIIGLPRYRTQPEVQAIFYEPMNHYCHSWIEQWCNNNGWSDPFLRDRREYWAFPPNGVMPLPIPNQALRLIKAEHGFSPDETQWSVAAVLGTLLASVASYSLQSPMPLVAAFIFCAIVVAHLELEGDA